MNRHRNRGRSGGGALSDPYAGATWRYAEPNARISESTLPVVSSRTHMFFRMPFYIGQDTERIRLEFWNYYVNSTNVDTNTGNSYNIEACAIESTTGVVQPLYFSGGSRRRVVQNGDDEIFTFSIGPLTGFSQFTRGEQYWMRGILSVDSTSHAFPKNTARNTTGFANAQYYQFNPSITTITNSSSNTNWAGAVDQTGLFAWTGTTATNGTLGFTPAVQCVPIVDQPCVLITGDSISNGSSDTTNHIYGYLSRALQNSGTLPICGFNMARSSTGIDYLKNGTKWKNRLKYINWSMENYGVNDFNINKSFATWQSDTEAVYAEMRSLAPHLRGIIRGDFMPYTTSTDSFVTTANQTVKVNGSAVAFSTWQDSLETWATSKLGDSTIQYFMAHPATRASATAPDKYKWVVTGAANYGTSDGLHPAANLTSGLQAEARTAFEFMT